MLATAAIILIGAAGIAAMFALSAVIISSQISRQEERYSEMTPLGRTIVNIIENEQPRGRH
jgi:hypothetical protein